MKVIGIVVTLLTAAGCGSLKPLGHSHRCLMP